MRQPNDHHAVAARLLQDLAANGGCLQPQPPAGFSLDFAPGADRVRCRRIAAEIRAGTALFVAVLDAVARHKREAA